MDLTTLLIGKGVDALLAILSGEGASETARKDRDAQLKMAADALGLNYEKLRIEDQNFDNELAQRADQFLKEHGLNKATLAEKIRAAKTQEGQINNTQLMQVADRSAQQQRQSNIRSQFSTAPKPSGAPTQAVVPSASKNVSAKPDAGAQALTGAQQGIPNAPKKVFPLSGQIGA